MTAVFHGISYGIFIDIKSNLRRKKPHRMNKVPIFFEAVLAIKTMKEPQSKFEEKTILDLFIFISIAPKLLDQPNKTICHFLSQSKNVSSRSDSSSEANSSSNQKSND